MVVSNIFYFHPYLGKIPILTNNFQLGWNHQPEKIHLILLASWTGGYDLESQMRLVFTESGPSSATEENNSFYLELNVDSRKASWMADTWGVGK